MTKENKTLLLRIWGAIAVFFAICFIFTINTFADGKATVTAQSANLRPNAAASGTPVGSVFKNEVLDVLGSESDGTNTWYKVKTKDGVTGYIRADLVTTEGVSQSTTATTVTTQQPASTEVTVPTESEPVSGKIKSNVNVRAGASTNHSIVANAKANTVVIVIGYATGSSDGKQWYQVTYNDNGKEINGYIRGDFINLDGALVEKMPVPDPVPESEPEPEPDPETEPEYKDFEAVSKVDEATGEKKWYLNNYQKGTSVSIDEIYAMKDNYEAMEAKYKKDLTKKKVTIGILIAIIVLLVGAGVYGFLTVRRWLMGDEEEDEAPAPKRREPAERKEYSRPERTSSSARAPIGATVGPTKRREDADMKVAPAPSHAKVPGGGVRLPDGRIQMPDGTIRNAVVAVKLADGSIKFPDGTIRRPDGTTIRPEQAQATVATPTESRVGASTHEVREVPYHRTSEASADDDMEYGFLDLDK